MHCLSQDVNVSNANQHSVIVFGILTSRGRTIVGCPLHRLCKQEWATAERLSDEAGGEWTDRWGHRRNAQGEESLVGPALREYQRVRNFAQ